MMHFAQLGCGDFSPQARMMIDWFLSIYCDPVENSPHDSAEGGFQFIYGGPYSAEDELRAHFEDAGGILDEVALLEVLNHLEEFCTEWTKLPTDEWYA